MRCFIGIDLGSTTTKAVVIDEQQNVLGRGITNSRSNYDTAAEIAKQEALVNARLYLFREALERSWAATPDPKWVVALGDCAKDGGLFAGSYACVGGVGSVVPVDLHIPGCPPSPRQILAGLLTLVGT